MNATSSSLSSQVTTQNLQNSLMADAQSTEPLPVSTASLSQVAINEFALRFNAAMIQMLTDQGMSNASPLSKKLKAYSSVAAVPSNGTSRFV